MFGNGGSDKDSAGIRVELLLQVILTTICLLRRDMSNVTVIRAVKESELEVHKKLTSSSR